MSRTDCKSSMESTDLIIRGRLISRDAHGYLSLNDIWRAAGERETKAPRRWQLLPTTRELIDALAANDRFSVVRAETAITSVIYSRKGNRGGTFAHVILALAYAEYLNPQLGIEVREIALRYWSGGLSLLDEFKQKQERQAQEDGNRVMARGEIRKNNFELNMIVREAGGRRTDHYASLHNAGYRGLYNGLDENAIHRRKGLRKEQAILDHMDFDELAANMFRTSVAQQRLRKEPVQTVSDACDVHMRTGERVRDFLQESGLTMPEDMPVADSIADANRRLKFSGKGQNPTKAVK